MTTFHSFEQKALRMLVGGVFSPASIDRIMREASDAQVAFKGSGYEVNIAHHELPEQSSSFDYPVVAGSYENLNVRFWARIEAGRLTLFCESIDQSPIPEYFRDRDIVVSVTQ